MIETIQVESGKILRLVFTHFMVHWGSTCEHASVQIIDSDGTSLMEKSCGYSSNTDPSSSSYFLPPIIMTRSNTVDIIFKTGSSTTDDGWSLRWSAVTPGLWKHFISSLSCSILHSTRRPSISSILPSNPLKAYAATSISDSVIETFWNFSHPKGGYRNSFLFFH